MALKQRHELSTRRNIDGLGVSYLFQAYFAFLIFLPFLQSFQKRHPTSTNFTVFLLGADKPFLNRLYEIKVNESRVVVVLCILFIRLIKKKVPRRVFPRNSRARVKILYEPYAEMYIILASCGQWHLSSCLLKVSFSLKNFLSKRVHPRMHFQLHFQFETFILSPLQWKKNWTN